MLTVPVVDSRGIDFNLVARRFRGNDAHGFAAVQVDEGGGHDAVVDELQGSAPQLYTGDKRDGIGGTAVDLHVKETMDST